MQDITDSEFMKEGRYLPEPMRDFHDQKDLFKAMSQLYGEPMAKHAPSWIDAQIFTVDYFLWFMASRGYTLQKCRKKGVRFKEWPKPDYSAMDAIIMGSLKSVDES